MKFAIVYVDAGDHPPGAEQVEHYNLGYIDSIGNAELWAKEVIEDFNADMERRGIPQERAFVRVERSTADTPAEHVWEKSNLVTIKGRGGMYDTVRCPICGATGKRFGIGGRPIPDKDKYRTCITVEEKTYVKPSAGRRRERT
jgi:hypothetical protein